MGSVWSHQQAPFARNIVSISKAKTIAVKKKPSLINLGMLESLAAADAGAGLACLK